MWVNIYIHSAKCSEWQFKKQSFLCWRWRRNCYTEVVALIRHSVRNVEGTSLSVCPVFTFLQGLWCFLTFYLLCIFTMYERFYICWEQFFASFFYTVKPVLPTCQDPIPLRSPVFTPEVSILFSMLVFTGIPVTVYSFFLALCWIKGLGGELFVWGLFSFSRFWDVHCFQTQINS